MPFKGPASAQKALQLSKTQELLEEALQDPVLLHYLSSQIFDCLQPPCKGATNEVGVISSRDNFVRRQLWSAMSSTTAVLRQKPPVRIPVQCLSPWRNLCYVFFVS